MNGQATRFRTSRKKGIAIATFAAALVFVVLALTGCASDTPPNASGEPNGLWELFCQLMANIVEIFYGPVGDWGMAIILVTIVFRIIISPLTISQTKSSYQMQKISPKVNEIRQRFADDPTRQQEEMQKVYADAKYNPLAGCVPMLLQMPIFIALFTVLRNITVYFSSSMTYTFYNIIPDLLLTPSDTFSQGFAAFLPYLILMLIFAVVTFLPMVLQQLSAPESSQRTQMFIMAGVMSVMMLWISWGSPAGVLLFWGTSSIIAVVQQQVVMRNLKRKDAQVEEEVAEQQIIVDVERKTKKQRPKKKR